MSLRSMNQYGAGHDSHFLRAAGPTRAVTYLRVSSIGQVARDYEPEGISIPAQRLACQRKAAQLGITIVDEYVEPGRSAREMSKRVAFQQLLTRVRTASDVTHILVDKLSRMARNRIDDALVMADLRQRGITLISATESIDDSPVGQLMHGILSTVNEYQSRESGADIAYKMGQKARNGGTISRARLGYVNHIDRAGSRDVRTVVIDPERAHLVRLGFELFATNDYTLTELADVLYDRGLRTRPTARYPAARVSISKLAHMLRDHYYLGCVTYMGEEYPGRHEPLIDEDLFHRVQRVCESRAAEQERRRVHHHYLKGSLFCAHCHSAGTTRRMIIRHTVNRHGIEYRYFFCRGKQPRTCPTRYISVADAEAAVEQHYATLHLTPRQREDLCYRLTSTAENTATDRPDLRGSHNTFELYRRCSDEQRRHLNQTIFRKLYIAGDRITSHELNTCGSG